MVDLRADSGGFLALLADGRVVNFGNLAREWNGWGGSALTLGPRSLGSMFIRRFDQAVIEIGGMEGISCALLQNGQVRCWVQGAADTVLIAGLEDVVAIGRGNALAHHQCVRKADRTVWCWGNNHFGQVDGNTRGNAYEQPVQVDAWP